MKISEGFKNFIFNNQLARSINLHDKRDIGMIPGKWVSLRMGVVCILSRLREGSEDTKRETKLKENERRTNDKEAAVVVGGGGRGGGS